MRDAAQPQARLLRVQAGVCQVTHILMLQGSAISTSGRISGSVMAANSVSLSVASRICSWLRQTSKASHSHMKRIQQSSVTIAKSRPALINLTA